MKTDLYLSSMAPGLEASSKSSSRQEPRGPQLMLQRELDRLRIGGSGVQIKFGPSADRCLGRDVGMGIGGSSAALQPELLIILHQLVGLEPSGSRDREES